MTTQDSYLMWWNSCSDELFDSVTDVRYFCCVNDRWLLEAFTSWSECHIKPFDEYLTYRLLTTSDYLVVLVLLVTTSDDRDYLISQCYDTLATSVVG